MRVRKQLLVALRTALVTAAGLFALQLWYASYLDVVRIHGQLGSARGDAKLEALRSEEQAQLSSGRMPITQAMAVLAQRGRNAFPLLAPQPSSDLSAMSGWIHKPGFKVYVPRIHVPRQGSAR
ncbi:MAG TPA: hypothetical protein VFM12_06240 [Gemmatimonadales bacterium]|nr:hypothetical protein [Gemmatimonadales bacterium]